MLEKGKISVRQFTILACYCTIGSSALLIQSILVSEAKQTAWLAGFLGVGIGLLLVGLYSALGVRFPQMTFVQYSEKLLGKWIGKFVSLCFIFAVPFILAAFILRDIADFITTQIMPETPIIAVEILTLLIFVLSARIGIQAIGRASEIFFPWVILLFLVLVFLISFNIEFTKIQPVLGEGVKPVLRAVVDFVGFPFLELIYLLMIFPYVNQVEKAGRAFLIGTAVGGGILIVTIFLAILVLGVSYIEIQQYPLYVLGQKINLGGYIERMELIVAGFWIITIFFKGVICYYTMVLGLAQVLDLQDYRSITLPVGICAILFSFMIPNVSYFMKFTSEIWFFHILPFGAILPFSLFCIATFKNR